jgi:hypothetical protein
MWKTVDSLKLVGVVTKEASSPFANKGSAGHKLKNSLIQLPDTEWKRDRLGSGCLVEPGVTVTLKDHSMHEGDAMHW